MFPAHLNLSGPLGAQKNGATAGKLGEGKRIEAIQVKLVLR